MLNAIKTLCQFVSLDSITSVNDTGHLYNMTVNRNGKFYIVALSKDNYNWLITDSIGNCLAYSPYLREALDIAGIKQ